MDKHSGSPTTARALDDYLRARSTLAPLVADTPRVPERDPDDHTDEDRAVSRARLKNMAADALAHLDAMHEDATRCMQVLAKTVQQLEEDDRTLHFALPLVDESLGLLDTSRARLDQALRTMATAEARGRAAAYEARGRMVISLERPSISQSSLEAIFQHLADMAL